MKELLEALARGLVDDPRRVRVRERVDDDFVRLDLEVSAEDRGRVIGRGGRTADALRFPDLSLSVIKRMGSGEYAVDVPGEAAPGHFGLHRVDGDQELRARPPHPLVGPPSLHAPLLRGGTELSTYAAACRLGIERRTVPGESAAGVQAEIEALFEQTTAADPSFKATVRCLLARNAFEVSPEASIVRAVRAAATRHLGRAAALIGKPFWMASAILADAGVETVIIGPIGGGAHTGEEWVDLQSLEDLAGVLAEAAMEYCG